jgi:hypothetical protein
MQRGTWTREPIYQVWENPDVIEEVEHQNIPDFDKYSERTKVLWRTVNVLPIELDRRPVKSPIDYFLLMYPMENVQTAIQASTAAILAAKKKGGTALTVKEWFQYCGFRISMCLHPLRGGLESYFKNKVEEKSLFQHAPNFGQFGLSENRFTIINDHFRLSQFTVEDTNDDPYVPIRSFLEAFNKRREKTIQPGSQIVFVNYFTNQFM